MPPLRLRLRINPRLTRYAGSPLFLTGRFVQDSIAVRVHVSDGNTLGGTMSRIRTWLDQNKIEPKSFSTAVADGGLTLTIRFRSEADAELFRAQFRSR